MQNLLDNIKKFFTKENWQKLCTFVVSERRYFIAAVLFLVMILILVNCTGPAAYSSKDSTEISTTLTDKKLTESDNEGLNTLIQAYFSAYAGKDLTSLEAIAMPLSDNEKSYVGVFSQYIENYQNLRIYYANSTEEGAYLVSVAYDMKFYGVDTPAPGLEFFYVQSMDDGTLFINNAYSSYNLVRSELEIDSTIYALIVQYEQLDEVVALQKEVEASYNEALSKDANLASMISSTIPAAMSQWIKSVQDLENAANNEAGQTTEVQTETTEQATEASEESETIEETEVSEETEASEAEEQVEEEATVITVVCLNDDVRIRNGAGTDSDVLGKAQAGDTYTKLGEEGSWTKIDYNGEVGYIATDFLRVQ